ncbi:hypothetical protein ACLB2K_040480 [Fragaria x ananassa]
MQYAQGNADGSGMFYCPCKMCKCRSDMHRFPLGTVWDHLKSNGFWERYTCWIYHGETSSRPHDHGQFDETGSTSNDPTTTFINDMFPHDSGVCPERQHIPQAPMQAVPRGVNTAGIAKYNRLIAFQQTPLCPGHEKTVLQCVMEVMHIKVDTKSTVTAVDRYLQYAASLLPDGHRHPTTHHKVRLILRDLGLSYIKIHACRYDCVLFWGKDADGNDLEGLHRCPVCGTDRYKGTPAGNRKPVKGVLAYKRTPVCQQRAHGMLRCLHARPKVPAARPWHARVPTCVPQGASSPPMACQGACMRALGCLHVMGALLTPWGAYASMPWARCWHPGAHMQAPLACHRCTTGTPGMP